MTIRRPAVYRPPTGDDYTRALVGQVLRKLTRENEALGHDLTVLRGEVDAVKEELAAMQETHGAVVHTNAIAARLEARERFPDIAARLNEEGAKA